jgi:hypothetical protein
VNPSQRRARCYLETTISKNCHRPQFSRTTGKTLHFGRSAACRKIGVRAIGAAIRR